MSYTHKRKTYELDFDGEGDFDGLKVKARGLSVGQYLQVAKLAEAKDQEAANELLAKFAEALVEWNVQDEDGNKLSTDLQGVSSCDFDFIMKIIAAWMTAVAGVSKELGKGSNSTATSLELQLPMEAA